MNEVRPDEAAKALAHIRQRQEQVVDVTAIPAWYWWAVGALMVGLSLAVETRRSTVIGLGVSGFVLGILAATGWVVRRALRVQVRNELLGARGVLLILGFVGAVVAVTLAVAFSLRAAGVGHPATLADLVGAAALIVGGPVLTRRLRRIMLANTAGGTR